MYNTHTLEVQSLLALETVKQDKSSIQIQGRKESI